MLGDLTQQSARGGSERSRWLLSAPGSSPGLALSSVPDHAPGSASGLPPRRCLRRPLRCCPPSALSSAPSSARPGFVGTAPRQSGRAEATRVSCVWRSSNKSRTLAVCVGFGTGLCAATRAGPRAGFCFSAPLRTIACADLRASVRPPRCPPHRPPRRLGFVSRCQCQTGRVKARWQSPVTARED